MNSKSILTAFALIGVAISGSLFGQATDTIETKVSIAAESSKGLKHDAPCFIVMPAGPSGGVLKLGGLESIVSQALEDKGYRVVDSESEAVVFVKVDYDLAEPFETSYNISQRPSVDYSNSAASHNHASTMAGGRYSELRAGADADAPGRSGLMLGPSGEVIDLAEVKPLANEIKPGESTSVVLTVRPIAFQMAAWRFESDDADAMPTRLWQVTANHENLKDELLEYQLEELAKVSSRYIGKSLKKPKLVSRSD